MTPDLLNHPSPISTPHPPLLFVHGAFVGAWCWEEQFVPFFQLRGHDCLALNFRGHGANRAGWQYLQLLGIDDYVQDLAWAIAQCPRPPVVIAHSMGGFVALRLLEQHTVDLAGLVLMSPASAKTHFESALRLLWDHPVSCSKLQLMNWLPRSCWPWVMTRGEIRQLMLSESSSLETPEKLLPKMQHESLLAMGEMLQADAEEPPVLDCPAVILCGAQDAIVPPEFVRQTAKWLGAELHVVPNMGHSMMLEDDWRNAAELLADWLDK